MIGSFMDNNEEKRCRDCFEKFYPGARIGSDGEYYRHSVEECWQACTKGWEACKKIREFH
jgi:hypothetical protein